MACKTIHGAASSADRFGDASGKIDGISTREVMSEQEKALRSARAGSIARISVPESSVPENYAGDPFHVRVPSAIHVITAGCKGFRFVDEAPEGAVPVEALIEALRKFLVIVDQVIIAGGIITIDGEGFPALAFEEFVEAILFRAVIVTPAGVAPGAIEIEGSAFFAPGDRDAEILAALLAGKHHEVFRLLKAHYTDPVWTLFQKQMWPGRAELFLNEVRRFRPAVSRAISSDIGTVMLIQAVPIGGLADMAGDAA